MTSRLRRSRPYLRQSLSQQIWPLLVRERLWRESVSRLQRCGSWPALRAETARGRVHASQDLHAHVSVGRRRGAGAAQRGAAVCRSGAHGEPGRAEVTIRGGQWFQACRAPGSVPAHTVDIGLHRGSERQRVTGDASLAMKAVRLAIERRVSGLVGCRDHIRSVRRRERRGVKSARQAAVRYDQEGQYEYGGEPSCGSADVPDLPPAVTHRFPGPQFDHWKLSNSGAATL
jgi:hypothetical protein